LTGDVIAQNLDRLEIKRDAAHLVALGVLLSSGRAPASDAPLDREHRLVQIDVTPPQAAELATAASRRHREPEERTPLGVLCASFRIRAASSADGGWGFQPHRSLRRALAVFVSSGARASELLAAAVGDVDWAGQRISVTAKGGARRLVPVSPEALLWLSRRGAARRLSYSALRRVLQRANERLGRTGRGMTCGTPRPRGWSTTAV
jgi:integrase